MKKYTIISWALAALSLPVSAGSLTTWYGCNGVSGSYRYKGQALWHIENPLYVACVDPHTSEKQTVAGQPSEKMKLKAVIAVLPYTYGNWGSYCGMSDNQIAKAQDFCKKVHAGKLVLRTELGLKANSEKGKSSCQQVSRANHGEGICYVRVNTGKYGFQKGTLTDHYPEAIDMLNSSGSDQFIAIDYNARAVHPINQGEHSSLPGLKAEWSYEKMTPFAY